MFLGMIKKKHEYLKRAFDKSYRETLNKLFFVLYLIFNPRLLIPLMYKIYLPVFVQFEWIKSYTIRTIIDIGAYHGDVAKVLQYFFKDAEIYIFEPIEENYQITRKNFKSDRVHINKIALSNNLGASEFYKNINNYELSSLLPFTQTSLKYEFAKKLEKIKVNTTTLDKFFKKREIKHGVFLKIDTQGTEGLILEGGKEFLKKVSIIHIETSFEKLYERQMLFPQIYSLLIAAGFEYIGECKDSYFYPNFEIADQVNCVFIKKRFNKKS